MGLKRSQGLSTGLIDLLETSNNANLAPLKWKVSFEVASRTRIELNKISYSFLNAREKVIEDFNYNFDEGNIYLIRGRSGIGKSTLIDILMGFRSIDSGSITYFRRNPNASFFNYVPQFPVILTESMATNISMNHARHDEDKLGELLDQLRLSSLGKNFKNLEDSNTGLASLVTASSLSGGEKQRISIARALYRDCEILAMDEPTSALDIKDAMQVMQIVKSKKIDKIIVIVSHDDLLLQFADHVIELK
jgi:ATP-binding cassette subfamily C protein